MYIVFRNLFSNNRLYTNLRLYSNSHISKVLIANRGEIACRVIKTAKKLGIKTVAVFSDADQRSKHVKMADEAYHLGPAESQESYLRSDKLISVALQSGCHAIHPGYGFLSENMEFAEQCKANRIIFIGPPASAIRDMGIKSTSKAIMEAAGVPTIQGYHGDDQSDETLAREAARIGYPIMIKAVRGGGGKGMRIARDETELATQLQSARTEARKAFNNDDMLLEKYMADPRHVEVQVFGDTHGNYVHLYERDCSVQRRHQKIIEEAPAPGLSDEVRRHLGAAATRAAAAVNYVGAGTVEFILDKNTHEYYFMEMNTRLQVEHPITEMVTNTDLVEWQFKVAAGEALPLKQSDIQLQGHAFEGRIYAEDTENGFLPVAGTLSYVATPPPSSTVRIETGVEAGDDISVYYDPMIAKLVVWGDDRQQALAKFRSNLLDYNVAGVPTNINFLLKLSSDPEFVAGNVHTHYIDQHRKTLFAESLDFQEVKKTAMLAVLTQVRDERKNLDPRDPFVMEGTFRVNHSLVRTFTYELNENTVKVVVTFLDNGHLKMAVTLIQNGGDDVAEDFMVADVQYNEVEGGGCLICFLAGSELVKGKTFVDGSSLNVFCSNGRTVFKRPEKSYLGNVTDAAEALAQAVSPMPGVIDKIFVEKNAKVSAGDALVTVIAMKMEYLVKAPRDGLVKDILHKVGDSVKKNSVLVRFDS